MSGTADMANAGEACVGGFDSCPSRAATCLVVTAERAAWGPEAEAVAGLSVTQSDRSVASAEYG
jgi:hypothetical protein